MKKEDFDTFTAAALSVMDDTVDAEFWDTERNILDSLLAQARTSLFAQQIQDEAEHAEYLRLKAKFEPLDKEDTRPDIPLGYTRDSNGNVLTRKDDDGYWCELTRDSNGNVLIYKNSRGYSEEHTYDSNGRILTFKDSNGYWYEFTRDAQGRVLERTNSEGENKC